MERKEVAGMMDFARDTERLSVLAQQVVPRLEETIKSMGGRFTGYIGFSSEKMSITAEIIFDRGYSTQSEPQEPCNRTAGNPEI